MMLNQIRKISYIVFDWGEINLIDNAVQARLKSYGEDPNDFEIISINTTSDDRVGVWVGKIVK